MQKAAAKKTETKATTAKEDKARPKSLGKEEKAKADKPEKSSNNIKKKDEVTIKKGMNAYMWFLQENREKVKKDNSELKNKELLSLLGKIWNELGDDGKKKYVDMAAKDKERYQKELEKSGVDNKKNNKKTKQPEPKKESNLIFNSLESTKKSKGKKVKSDSESDGEDSDD